MDLVVLHLFGAAPVGLINGVLHAICDFIGIKDDQSVGISGSTACCLGKGSVVAQETFFVCIQNGYEEWIYLTLMLSLVRYLVSSSAIRLVRVVTRMRSLISMRCWISLMRSSI